MSGNDWFLRKQAQLLQDLVDAKAITLELLENLAVLSKTFLQQAAENHFDVPNREAITHLVRRAEVLLRASGETADVVLDGRPRDKLTPYHGRRVGRQLTPVRVCRQVNRTLTRLLSLSGIVRNP